MQLIPEGPNIPEALLNAHADGDVVFFCGAGVSVDAGYPLFSGLVGDLISRNPVSDTPEMASAITAGEYDFALSMLQSVLGKGSAKLRKDTAEILSRRPLSLSTHRTILRLSRRRDGTCRLVTTNFDRLFVKAHRGLGPINVDCAPRLPVPRPDRWNSLLHLHGLLPAKPSDTALGDLILTSADFGEAYVTDSYCSRFVVELLRHYTVVFIGYSLNDRIMRYLLDAISFSERFLREEGKDGHFHKPYAFVEHNEDDKSSVIQSWELKEVIPIPYFVEKTKRLNRGSHHRLYETLDAWAELASGGQRARVTLALNEAQKPFLAEDTFSQERLLWALRSPDGKVAEALATTATKEQTASISWLPFFARNGLLDQVYSAAELQEEAARRQRDPMEALAPRYLGTVTNGHGDSRLKPLTRHLMEWLQWHLDTVELVDWVLENGGVPHPEFSSAYDRPRSEKGKSSLGDDQRRLWDILTSDAYARSHMPTSHWFGLRDSHDFRERVAVDEFVAHVAPKLAIRPSIYRNFEGRDGGYLGHFDFELKLADDEMDYPLGQIISTAERHEGLEVLCEQLTNAAWSGLNWLSLVDKTSKEHDLTGYSIPSISPHDQNEYVKEFGKLVFLLRAAFDRRLAIDVVGAVAVAQQWSHLNFPLFMRLFLYAANRCGSDLDQPALQLLARENGRWLWALDTTREVNVYLRERVQHWPRADIAKLCRVVLAGPERGNYRSMSTNKWRNVRDQIVAKYLKKLQQGGVALPASAIKRLAKLRAEFPYALPDDHSDEFVIYSGPVRDAEWGDGSELEPAAFREFSQRTPAERVAAWQPEQSSVLRKLSAERPLDALETLEEGLARDLQDPTFWSEGISGLAVAFEKFPPIAGEASR